LHISGKNNTPADALSQPSSDEQEVEDKQLSLIPPGNFLNIADADLMDSLETLLCDKQQQYTPWMKVEGKAHLERGLWRSMDHKLVVPPNQELRRQIMHAYHDGLMAHPGRDETTRKVLERFHWLGAKGWIEQYIKGCAICQQNKNLTHQTCVPLYKITIPNNALPFS